MIPPKGKAAMLIIANAKPKIMKKEEPSMMEGKEESGEGYDHEIEIIADDLLNAVQQKSKDGVIAALKAFKSCLQKEDEELDKEHEAEESPEQEKEEHEEYEG